MLDHARTRDNAPEFVQEAGGVLLSLWHFGAGETDLEIVACYIAQWRDYREALERTVVACDNGATNENKLVFIRRVAATALGINFTPASSEER
jgi:hypothetical protein